MKVEQSLLKRFGIESIRDGLYPAVTVPVDKILSVYPVNIKHLEALTDISNVVSTALYIYDDTLRPLNTGARNTMIVLCAVSSRIGHVYDDPAMQRLIFDSLDLGLPEEFTEIITDCIESVYSEEKPLCFYSKIIHDATKVSLIPSAIMEEALFDAFENGENISSLKDLIAVTRQLADERCKAIHDNQLFTNKGSELLMNHMRFNSELKGYTDKTSLHILLSGNPILQLKYLDWLVL